MGRIGTGAELISLGLRHEAEMGAFLDGIICCKSNSWLGETSAMRKANRISKCTIGVALVMTLIAFVLGSAPFTPALVLAVIALPLAIGCSFFGVWRLSVITIYWALAALLAVPMAAILPLRVDVSLVFLGVTGLALSAFLYISSTRAKPAT